MSEEADLPQTYAELRAMSDEDVVRAYDCKRHSTDPGLDMIRQELAFRENAKQTREMVNLTRETQRLNQQMTNLTRYILWLTIGNLVMTGTSILIAVAAWCGG